MLVSIDVIQPIAPKSIPLKLTFKLFFFFFVTPFWNFCYVTLGWLSLMERADHVVTFLTGLNVSCSFSVFNMRACFNKEVGCSCAGLALSIQSCALSPLHWADNTLRNRLWIAWLKSYSKVLIVPTALGNYNDVTIKWRRGRKEDVLASKVLWLGRIKSRLLVDFSAALWC